MGKKLVAVVAAVLVLAGCSAAPSDDGVAGEAPDTSSQRSAPVETSAPEPEFSEAELEFLGYMAGDSTAPNVEGKTPQEIVAAGWAACDLFAQGVEWGDMELIEGGHENLADGDIASLASQVLCPEYDITVTD